MTKFVGRRGGVAIARETTRGTAGSTLFWLPYAKLSFDDKTVTVRETQALGKIADGDSVYVTSRFGEGDVDTQVYDKALGVLLCSVLGAVPSTSGSNPYTHTFTLSQTNQPVSLTVFYQDPDYTKAFANSVVDSWKVKVSQNAIVDHTFAFKSKDSANWSTLTPNYTSLGSKYLHQQLRVKLATTVGGIAAAATLDLKDLELTVNKNAMYDNVLGTVQPLDILSQQLSVTGSFSLNKESDTYRQLMTAGTYQAMEIKLDGGANSTLTLQFPRVSFTNWEQDRGLDSIVSQKIQFTANYDAANALDIISTATLINTQATY